MTEDMKSHEPQAPVEHHQHHRERFWLILLAVLVIGGLLAIGILPRISNNRALAQGQKDAKSNVPSVVVVRPKLVADTGVSLPGNIEAYHQTTINARTTGYLDKLFVDIGSHVKKGDVLAILRAPDVDQQAYQAIAQTVQQRQVVKQYDASVEQARANVRQAQAEVLKQQATIEQAQAQQGSAEAAVAQAKAVQEGDEANLEHMQQQLKVQQANLKTQQANVNFAQASYNRYKGLVEQGFDTQQDLDQQLATLKTNQAAVVSAEASIASAQSDIVTAQKVVAAAAQAVSAAQANVTAAQKNVSLNQAELKATQATVKYNQEIVKVNQATVAANVAGVKASVANENHYKVMQKFQQVLAPFDGVITARGVDVGVLLVGDTGSTSAAASTATLNNSSISTSGAGMLGIARTDIVRIQVSVPQSFVTSMKTGAGANVSVRELPQRQFVGTITMQSGAMDSVSRTQLVEVDLPNPDGALVPGMYAQVQITPEHPTETLQIPGTALIVDANGVRVGIVKADNTVHMQKVVIGRDFGTTVEILKGLKGRERIVNNPSDLLQDGDKVQITQAVAKPGGGKGGRGGAAGGPGGAAGAPSATGGAPGAAGADAPAPGRHGAPADSDAAPGTGGNTPGGKPDADSGATPQAPTGGGSTPGGHHHKGAAAGGADAAKAANDTAAAAAGNPDKDTDTTAPAASGAPATGGAPGAGGHHHHKDGTSGAGAGADANP